jgi:hypothetical protein
MMNGIRTKRLHAANIEVKNKNNIKKFL